MFPEAFLPDAKLQIVAVEFDSAGASLQLRLRSLEIGAVCPYCGQYSESVRSEYECRLKDLPCSGHGVSIVLEVRRFFWKAASCLRKTFSERLPELILIWLNG